MIGGCRLLTGVPPFSCAIGGTQRDPNVNRALPYRLLWVLGLINNSQRATPRARILAAGRISAHPIGKYAPVAE